MRDSEKIYYKLTHPQKRIWYINKINTNLPLHNIGGCLNIFETINVGVMKETINWKGNPFLDKFIPNRNMLSKYYLSY